MRNCASEVWSFGPSRNDGVSDGFAGACHRARVRATRWLAMTRMAHVRRPRTCRRFANIYVCEAAESEISAVLLRSNELLRSNTIHTPDVTAGFPPTSMARKPATNLETGNAQASCYRIDVDRTSCARHQRNGIRR